MIERHVVIDPVFLLEHVLGLGNVTRPVPVRRGWPARVIEPELALLLRQTMLWPFEKLGVHHGPTSEESTANIRVGLQGMPMRMDTPDVLRIVVILGPLCCPVLCFLGVGQEVHPGWLIIA